MTTADGTDRPAPPPDGDAAHASLALLERLADKLGARASVTAVYGESVTRDGVTVIPVAEVAFGFGGGAGRERGSAKTGEGGGGGGGVRGRPCGFIEIKDGSATYKPIRAPWGDVVMPLAALLAGTAVPRIARRLAVRRAR
ncbi:spore germination protein GerW family protein [Streptomyces cavernicola]|uniref:Spore germination protein GerW family protein n=1 Tax=Streptomyces cavernicola TaxID=3043613 RepID=A0ABT6SF45_9ACTN|nr:spore germination protein GerW family protein [Streptomyces sp. B-S-A6]MDI3406474.1 spore germination protein GerW family protein [Streptomyces sp. B-S-A6]